MFSQFGWLANRRRRKLLPLYRTLLGAMPIVPLHEDLDRVRYRTGGMARKGAVAMKPRNKGNNTVSCCIKRAPNSSRLPRKDANRGFSTYWRE